MYSSEIMSVKLERSKTASASSEISRMRPEPKNPIHKKSNTKSNAGFETKLFRDNNTVVVYGVKCLIVYKCFS